MAVDTAAIAVEIAVATAIVELLALIKWAVKRRSAFRKRVQNINDILSSIGPIIYDLPQHHPEKMEGIKGLFLRGKVLVDQCLSTRRFSICQRCRLSKMLKEYEEELGREFQFCLPLLAVTNREILRKMDARGDEPSLQGQALLPPAQSPAMSRVPSLLHLSFNQDFGCFAVGTDNGFRIYNCDPFREIFRRDFDSDGGIAVVEMLFRCNILALVGSGSNARYPVNKVMIWDDHQSRCIGELSFRSEVKSVKLRRDRIVVILLQKIYVYNFADLKLLHQIETIANPKGLCVVSQSSGQMVLVCPGLQKGQVRVEHYASKRTKFIMAHDSRIAAFALAQDGRFLATASSKGTLVRVFNTLDGSLLQEVRRGADRAEIYSLAFSSTAQWLAVSSDKGTVHVFGLKTDSNNDRLHNTSENHTPSSSMISSLSLLKGFAGVLPKYFSSEWSVAQFRLHEGLQYVVAFGHQKNTVLILGMDGSFYRCQFDPRTRGEMTQLEYYNFLKPDETL